MISDEECRLWHLATTEPGALEGYIDWLLENDPKRGKLVQKVQRKHALKDTLAYTRSWVEALGLHRFDELDFDALPTGILTRDSRVATLGPVLERLPFLHVRMQCSANQTFQHPAFANIRSLSIWAHTDEMDPDENGPSLLRTYHGSAVVRPLCASPQLSQLETLRLLGQEFGAECGAIVASGTFRNLRALSIGDEPIGDAGATALAESPVVATLRKLSLCQCKIGDAGATALARSPHLATLEELDLANNAIGADAVAVLRARFPRVRVVLGPWGD